MKTVFLLLLLFVGAGACSKDKAAARASVKTVVYEATGTHFKVSFLNERGAFLRDQTQSDSFHYEFRRGSGGQIGLTVMPLTSGDRVFSWNLYINGKLYANALAEGGSYMTVPYD